MAAPVLRNKLLLVYGVTFAVMCLLLFFSAGTLRYWQAWLYLAVFMGFGLILSFILLRDDPHLLASRLTITPLAEPELKQKIIQCANGVLFVTLLIVCAADFGAHGAHFPAWATLLADLAVLSGGRLLYLVLKANKYAAATVRVQSGQTVISTGPYAVVRHPMYAWAMLFFLVTPPALGSVWGFVPALPACGVLVARLLSEERYLRANLPGYTEYCGQVRWRILPLVW